MTSKTKYKTCPTETASDMEKKLLLNQDCYGISYIGSKGKLCKWIVDNLPPAEHFYDLFAGGCAVTHYALASGKYKYVHANDINDYPAFFKDIIDGKYEGYNEWVSREDFHKRKNEPLVKSLWSFSGLGETYIFNRYIEPYAKARHAFILKGDISLLSEYLPESDLLEMLRVSLKQPTTWKQKLCRHGFMSSVQGKYVKNAYRRSGRDHSWIAPFADLCDFLHLDIEQIKQETLSGLFSRKHAEDNTNVNLRCFLGRTFQQLIRFHRLYEAGLDLGRLFITQTDYQNVPIHPNSVIYCDIPYRNTRPYELDGQKIQFDHARFYDWAKRQSNIYISEFTMPEPFQLLDQIKRVNGMSKSVMQSTQEGCDHVTERLYCHNTKQPKTNLADTGSFNFIPRQPQGLFARY